MKAVLPKLKLHPFRILALLHYGSYPWATWESPVRGHLKLGPLWRILRVPSSRGRDYLKWLQDSGYISNLELGRGEATLELRVPPRLAAASQIAGEIPQMETDVGREEEQPRKSGPWA